MSDKYILVLNKYRQKIATLTERDNIISCEISHAQNNESTLSITISKEHEKYRLITQAENYFIADGKEYVLIKPDESLTETRTENGGIIVEIIAVESYYLLKKRFVTSFNSTTNFDHIDNHMVVVLSGGNYPLVTNWETIEELNPYEKGTAAYAMFAILYGTGWSVGTVDVEGIHDLETDKKSVWDNIKQIKEFWGGILELDSIAKTVSLRDEEKYKEYTGFQLRYGKNIKSVTRKQVNDIVTRLYVYGYQGLNIADDNDGKEYIEDFRYTDTIYEGIITNNDITDQRELKNWAIKQIAKMCQPAVKLSTEMIDLREFNGYQHENFKVNSIVDVVDDDLLEEQYQARIIKHSYPFFAPYMCSIEVGDETPRFEDKFKYVLDNSDYVTKLIQQTTGEVPSINIDFDWEEILANQKFPTTAIAAGKNVTIDISTNPETLVTTYTINAFGGNDYNGGEFFKISSFDYLTQETPDIDIPQPTTE